MKFIPFLLFSALLLSCSENAKLREQAPLAKERTALRDSFSVDSIAIADTGMKQTDPDSVNKGQEFYLCYKNFIRPVVFKKTVNIYSKPDTSGKIIRILKFNTPLNFAEESDCFWYKIKLDTLVGYIKENEVASHTFYSSRNKNIQYFVVTDLETTKEEEAPEAIIYKFDLVKKVFVDTFEVKEIRGNLVKQISSAHWKNTDLILYFENTNGCCGCTLEKNYMIDANGSFQKLFTTFDYLADGGDGEAHYSNVSIPENPQSDTILFEEYEYGGLFNKKTNEPVLDKKGRQKSGVLKDIKIYYQWDGVKLVERRSTGKKKTKSQ